MAALKIFVAILIFSAFPGDSSADGDKEDSPPGTGWSDWSDPGGQGGPPTRKKRAMSYTSGLWPNDTAHWEIANYSNNIGYQKVIKYVTAMFEYYTVLRFVAKPAGHSGPYAIFNCTGQASSYVGRYGNGQQVQCCSQSSCSHEIGHMLGMVHEQYNTERQTWIQMDTSKAASSWINEYYRRHSGDYVTYGYFDYASMMLYPNWWNVAVGGQKMYRFFDNDLEQLKNQYGSYGTYWSSYYPAAELNHRYGVSEYCPSFTATCQNKGYLTKLGDTCQCRCTTGLSSSSNCAVEEETDSSGASLTWPTASFLLLAPKSGCPSKFDTGGYVKHQSTADIVFSDHFDANSTTSSQWITHTFCSRDSTTGNATFDEGFYCLYKGSGNCPSGFEESSIWYEDKDGSTTETSGSIPSGTYGSNIIGGQGQLRMSTCHRGKYRKCQTDDTIFEFCCRMDGYHQRPISLPTSDNFILFPVVDKCQEVKGMQAIMQSYYFQTSGNTTGVTPYMTSTFTMYYCYYTLKEQECGGVIELNDTNTQATIQSPNYPSNYPDNKMCTWFIKLSPGTDAKIFLDFTDFDIHKHTSGECLDSVEVRHSLPGNIGMKYCGNLRPPSLVSQFDTMVVYLRSDHSTNAKGFNATAKLWKQDSLCYRNNGHYGSYSGDVSTTRLHHSCVPWSAAKRCLHHAFKDGDRHDDLRENYCRNPGGTDRPWCYTSDDTCTRDYCDVCAREKCRDSVADCSSASCSNTFEGEDKLCAQTCDNCPTDNSVASCSAPSSISGTTLSGTSSTYNLGHKITYTCNSDNKTRISQRCSSDGSWKPDVNFVCGGCPTGYGYVNGSCYKYVDSFVDYDTATSDCAADNASLVNNEAKHVTVIAAKLKDAQLTAGSSVWASTPVVEEYSDDGCFDDTSSTTKKLSYNGTTAEDEDGDECTPWTSSRNTDYRDVSTYPESTLAGASNYCRNPSASDKTWCYTTDGSWGWCNIPECPSAACFDDSTSTTRKLSYNGTIAVTDSGVACRAWTFSGYNNAATYPDASVADASNYCRNPSASSKTWCYTPSGGWGWCSVPVCEVIETLEDDGCFDDSHTRSRILSYNGTTNTTENGVACTAWTSSTVYTNAATYPDSSIADASNYCRNPTASSKPWCFTATSWGYCKIPACPACHTVTGLGAISERTCKNTLPYTCVFSPSSRSVCKDQDNDCDDKLEASPTMCVDYPDFAWQRCARTCGRCSDSNPNSDNSATCTLPSASSNSAQEGSASSLSVGAYVRYTCNSGHVLTSGSLERACKKDGNLTGAAPVCSDVTATDWWTDTETALRDRDAVYTERYITFSKIKNRIPAAGKVTKWRFYARNTDKISLVIMRKISTTSYTLVGVNDIIPKGDRVETVDIPVASQISVLSGDLVGVHCEITGSGVPYDPCVESEEPSYSGLMRSKWRPRDLAGRVGDAQDVKEESGCRKVSVRAFVDVP